MGDNRKVESDDYRPEDRDWQRQWLIAQVELEAKDLVEERRLQAARDPDYSEYRKGMREGQMLAFAKVAEKFGLVDSAFMRAHVKSSVGEEVFDLGEEGDD